MRKFAENIPTLDLSFVNVTKIFQVLISFENMSRNVEYPQ